MKNIYTQIDELQKKINEHRPLPNHLLEQIKEYYRIGLDVIHEAWAEIEVFEKHHDYYSYGFFVMRKK